MKLLKLLIPKEKAQEVTELESYTVRWEIQANGYKEYEVFHKSFINKDDAHEYEKQLKESANFIGAWVRTNVYKN